jgi:hypothetical chaperone protein
MIGFDYGTSNCSVASCVAGRPHIIPLVDNAKYLASNLYAPARDIIPHWLYQQLNGEAQVAYKESRSNQLQKAQGSLRELAFDGIDNRLLFGQAALDKYLEDPEEGYYIKSPKSFLGSSDLQPQQIQLFEDIVACMMGNVKKLTEKQLGHEINQTVIGRPINFQGLHGEESNRQAINVLTKAAKRVGFRDVEFQFEPVAAGFEFEASLTSQKRVLVVDIGGGTSDCSMLLMGPELIKSDERSGHLLAHTGVRVAGNDFDIQLALQGIMPSLGMKSLLKTGIPMPIASYRQAVSINNINEQTEFYSSKNRRHLVQLSHDAKEKHLVERLIDVHDQKLSYQLVNGAEQAKINLSDKLVHEINFPELDSLSIDLTRELFRVANERTLQHIGELMQLAVKQANCMPDVIFVTGGTAKSPVINDYIKQQIPNVPVVIGDHFGSVTSGLARWANKIYR